MKPLLLLSGSRGFFYLTGWLALTVGGLASQLANKIGGCEKWESIKKL
jgi:hypothetical protein